MNITGLFDTATIIEILILFGALLSVVFTSGVIWRVEKQLDASFKLYLVALFFFTASEIFSWFSFEEENIALYASLSRLFFILLFLVGILVMRNMIRNIDGEK